MYKYRCELHGAQCTVIAQPVPWELTLIVQSVYLQSTLIIHTYIISHILYTQNLSIHFTASLFFPHMHNAMLANCTSALHTYIYIISHHSLPWEWTPSPRHLRPTLSHISPSPSTHHPSSPLPSPLLLFPHHRSGSHRPWSHYCDGVYGQNAGECPDRSRCCSAQSHPAASLDQIPPGRILAVGRSGFSSLICPRRDLGGSS